MCTPLSLVCVPDCAYSVARFGGAAACYESATSPPPHLSIDGIAQPEVVRSAVCGQCAMCGDTLRARQRARQGGRRGCRLRALHPHRAVSGADSPHRDLLVVDLLWACGSLLQEDGGGHAGHGRSVSSRRSVTTRGCGATRAQFRQQLIVADPPPLPPRDPLPVWCARANPAAKAIACGVAGLPTVLSRRRPSRLQRRATPARRRRRASSLGRIARVDASVTLRCR